ncbi:MAG: type II toxin-antitoxin system HicA family toxin [Nitrospirae bacterium]|nr:type II toxin-antitoxin system HicA family toxin [Nitrospirota bacterium]
MAKLSGINHLRAVKAFMKIGYRIKREGKHVIITNGSKIITIPRHNPINAVTMGFIVEDAGLTIDKFKELL